MKQAGTPTTPQMDGEKASEAPEPPVLVAVDFSQESEAVLNWASDYADAIGAPLEILHVVHDPAGSPGTYKPEGKDPLEPMADVAERKLNQFLERMMRDHPNQARLNEARLLCVEGLPASKIVDVAHARDARLLVLGGGRRSGLGRLVQGSTAHQAARHSRIPVTIIKADS